MKPKQLTLLVVLAVVILLGCKANRPYRRSLPLTAQTTRNRDTNRPSSLPPIDPWRDRTIEDDDPRYKLGFVEFDDQGWFWSHNQWAAVKEAIENVASTNQGGLVLVVFVHGWKNNAEFDSRNVLMFRQVLTNLYDRVTTADNSNTNKPPSVGPRTVFGVYLGWRGLSTVFDYFPPLGKQASFYRRKAVAERIGRQGAATQVFAELELMQAAFNAKRTNSPQTKLIVIGHSFGGGLLFAATSQVLTEHLVWASRRKEPAAVRWLGDLVVLLNPAFEASIYENVISLATSSQLTYPPDQRPVLAIFTSKTDWATKKAFPLGRLLSTWSEAKRPRDDQWLFNISKSSTPDQNAAILETVGNDADYLTHTLIYTNYSNSKPPPKEPGTKLPKASVEQIQQLQSIWSAPKPEFLDENPSFVFPGAMGTNRYACILRPLDRTRFGHKTNSPFLNVSVDKNIMNGHSDLSNPILVEFLVNFLTSVQTNYSSTLRR